MNIEPNFSHNFFKCLQYLFIPRRDMQVLEELLLCILLHEKFCMDISVLHKFISLMYSNQIFGSNIASMFNPNYSRKTRYDQKTPLSLYIFVVLNH